MSTTMRLPKEGERYVALAAGTGIEIFAGCSTEIKRNSSSSSKNISPFFLLSHMAITSYRG
jgi:hypothetical protein